MGKSDTVPGDESQAEPALHSLHGRKVAIVHDWLVGGGAEKVVEQLHVMFPDAPIYTSFATKNWQKRLNGKVITGYLQNWPFSKLRKFLPLLRQFWFSHLDLSAYDVIISSSGNGEAKFVRVTKGATHICYCHTPTHFYWRHSKAYKQNPGFGPFNSLARFGLSLLTNPLKRADYRAAQRVDFFIANSSHIAADIQNFYDRDAKVIFPPVAVDSFSASNQKDDYFITVGRLVPNKKVDLMIKACNKINARLVVIGKGPELRTLKKLAGPTISFITNASDAEVAKQLQQAKAFVFAGFEDFGIAPVEALASGTPVIAYRAGGALDYVVEEKTGQFFDEQTVESLKQSLKAFDPEKYHPEEMAKAAKEFSTQNFHKKIKQYLAKTLGA